MPEFAGERTLTMPVGTSVTTTLLPLQDVSQGSILMPNGWTGPAAISFLVADEGGNTYPLFSGGALVQVIPAAGESHPIPVDVFNANEVYLWSQFKGVSVPQAATRLFVVQTKE